MPCDVCIGQGRAEPNKLFIGQLLGRFIVSLHHDVQATKMVFRMLCVFEAGL